jgi:5-methylcytosine-specific restriction endonuclease McrA
VKSALQALQAVVDVLPTYADRVGAVPRLCKNARSSESFKNLEQTLEATSAGNSRCMFCEDSAANEIEHLRPKSLYPEATFDPANYVLSCGVCNKCKGSKFAVFADPTDEFTRSSD